MKNADAMSGTDIVSTPTTGSIFACGQIPAGQTPRVKLVGAFPAINSLQVGDQLIDSVTGFSLHCE